jgi:hypothetical protein
MPEGVAITGPEMVEPTLAVVANDGKTGLFVAKGQKSALPGGRSALARATTVAVRGPAPHRLGAAERPAARHGQRGLPGGRWLGVRPSNAETNS